MITERPLEDVGEPPDAIREWAERVVATWGLTDTERDTVWLMLKGMSDQEIADILKVSHAVTRHRLDSIRKKAGVGSRGELFAEILRL